MKHFQRKSLKIFDLHPPLRRLVPFVVRIITWKVRCWVTDTHTHTHTHTHADTHTDTQTKYCNPRCTCVPRVNNYKASTLAQAQGFRLVTPDPFLVRGLGLGTRLHYSLSKQQIGWRCSCLFRWNSYMHLMYGKYTLFYESPKNWGYYAHAQTVCTREGGAWGRGLGSLQVRVSQGHR